MEQKTFFPSHVHNRYTEVWSLVSRQSCTSKLWGEKQERSDSNDSYNLPFPKSIKCIWKWFTITLIGCLSLNTGALAAVIMRWWKAARRVCSKFKILGFRRVEFGLFRDLLGKVPWDKALKAGWAQKGWLILKDCLLKAQVWCIPTN